jgi:hypothetical protein
MAKKQGTPATKWQPVYMENMEFESHLFELKTSKMMKNLSWSTDNPEISEVDHQHFFHTCDSSGQVMQHSTATGGHFHIITIETDPETGAPIAKCSGPKTFEHKKGKKFIVDLPAYKAVGNDGQPIKDTHTHDTKYVRTSRVRSKPINVESVKVIDQLETSKAAPIEGVHG